jgi:hypothetical protein
MARRWHRRDRAPEGWEARPLPRRRLGHAAPFPMASASVQVPVASPGVAAEVMSAEVLETRPTPAASLPDPVAATPWMDQELVPGVRNLWLALGSGALLLLLMMRTKR